MTAMTDALQSRRLACAQCGAEFSCNLDGGCWCAEETFRLPMPAAAGTDCLCPDCLRHLAQKQLQQQ